jgi:hypothetical protein
LYRDVYAQLRVYHRDADPADVTFLLDLQPTGTQRAHFDVEAASHAPDGWFLSSEGQALDEPRDHATWLADQIKGKQTAFESLRAAGWTPDVWLVGTSDADWFFDIRSEAIAAFGDLGLSLGFMLFVEPEATA